MSTKISKLQMFNNKSLRLTVVKVKTTLAFQPTNFYYYLSCWLVLQHVQMLNFGYGLATLLTPIVKSTYLAMVVRFSKKLVPFDQEKKIYAYQIS